MSRPPHSTTLALRDALAGIDPYPWESVETWKARALPVFRQQLPEHLDDFTKVTAVPGWLDLPRWKSRGNRWKGEPPRDNSAEASAREETSNRKRACEKKQQILAWLDGLIEQLADQGDSAAAPTDPVDEVLQLLDRVPLVVRALAARGRSRKALTIDDEYDLQYLTGALLRLLFDDVRPEEWTPSYANSSSRIDFILKDPAVAIETKYVRKDHDDRSIGDELIVDKERYRSHPDCETLVCFVYDPGHRLQNATGLERDLSQNDGLQAIVLVRPK